MASILLQVRIFVRPNFSVPNLNLTLALNTDKCDEEYIPELVKCYHKSHCNIHTTWAFSVTSESFLTLCNYPDAHTLHICLISLIR